LWADETGGTIVLKGVKKEVQEIENCSLHTNIIGQQN
jgi:hypothetical protein